MKTYLLLPHLIIHNANAMSSCYTIGLPSMTAWLGFTHAMERELADTGIKCVKVAVAVHNYHLHTCSLKGNRYKSIIISANPLKKKGGQFERPPFIPEGRIDLETSLLIEILGIDGDNESFIKRKIQNLLLRMKIAGGDILNEVKAEVYYVTDNEQVEERKVIYKLMPSYVITERKDIFEKQEGDDIEKLLRCLRVDCIAELADDGTVNKWNYFKEYPGWLVPIVVGYRGISSVNIVDGQRDCNYEHQFVEPLVTVGEFKLSCRVSCIDEIMWQYSFVNNDMYLCSNNH